jgi:putative membrane protein
MENNFEINEDKVSDYFYWRNFFVIISYTFLLWFTLIGIPVSLILAFLIPVNISRRQAKALKYWCEGSTLKIEEGIIFIKRKAIPLDRITDIVMSQGPFLRYFNIWRLDIQTAGMGTTYSEGRLYGLKNPEQVKEDLIKRRDEIIKLTKVA